MICPNCRAGFVCEPTPKPFILAYRGFTKQIGTQVYLSCSNCLYASVDPLELNVDIDAGMALFRREVNMRLSTGEDL